MLSPPLQNNIVKMVFVRWLALYSYFILLGFGSWGDSVSTTAGPTSKWETSRVWPAITGSEQDLDETAGFGLLHANSIRWEIITDNEHVRQMLNSAQNRFEEYLQAAVPESPSDFVRDQNVAFVDLQRIRITIQSPNTTLYHGMDESYNLTSSTNNDIEVHAATAVGGLYALETLKQLLQFAYLENNHHVNNSPVYQVPRVQIQDAPEYSYRGLMLDTSRHFLNLQSIILPNLYVMHANKLNVFHWHLTDRESWAWQSNLHPELAEFGAVCDVCVYTESDIQLVVDTAANLGIRVIVEVDLPGHIRVLGASHPELMSECNDGTAADVIDPTNNATMVLVRDIYRELTDLFPDNWIHIGADEVKVECWTQSARIQAWLNDHNMTSIQLLEQFVNELVDIVTIHHSRRPIMWEDPFVKGINLPKHVIIDCWQMWRMSSSIVSPVRAGFDILVSGCWYLDHLGLDWWSFHGCNPRGYGLTEAQQQQVLGGHASMWGESVDAENFFERVWPRASATAEVLWSGTAPNHDRGLDKDAVTDRLSTFRCYLVTQFGIQASPIFHGNGYCEAADRLFGAAADDEHIATVSSDSLFPEIQVLLGMFLAGVLMTVCVVWILICSKKLQIVDICNEKHLIEHENKPILVDGEDDEDDKLPAVDHTLT